jgi:branched-chain amino acid aminotransferase
MKVFVNNKLVTSEKATVSVFDHGLLYGDGVFETLRSYNGVVFKLDAHLKRLKRSSSLIKLHLPYSRAKLSTSGSLLPAEKALSVLIYLSAENQI